VLKNKSKIEETRKVCAAIKNKLGSVTLDGTIYYLYVCTKKNSFQNNFVFSNKQGMGIMYNLEIKPDIKTLYKKNKKQKKITA
jgi:mannose/fructose/N-acetylgalactosamine-specific phosphotransferase system component IID